MLDVNEYRAKCFLCITTANIASDQVNLSGNYLELQRIFA